MTSRRQKSSPPGQAPLVDQFDSDVESLRSTVKNLKAVSDGIGVEIKSQNQLLKEMSGHYQTGVNMIGRLNEGMKKLWKASNFSPMSMLLVFAFVLFAFLWFYWKVFA